MNHPAKVPIYEQAQRAREHYEELANNASHWSSIIPQAIDSWERERLSSNRVRQNTFAAFCGGVIFGMFVMFVLSALL